MIHRITLALLAASILSVCFPAAAGAQARKNAKKNAEGIEFFEKRIRPVLVKECYRCHSEESKRSRGGLLLDTRDGIRKGGDSGHGVVPGNLKSSLVLRAITYADKDLQMPPDEKLPDSVIADFRRWIDMGAPDPRTGKKTVAGKYGSDEKLWSLEPIRAAKAPVVKNASWARGDIDLFVQAKQEEKGLKVVGDAEPISLLRRVYSDLIGLPPTPAEIDAFLKDCSEAKSGRKVPQQAWEKLVDRLLASPHFGERWGRHWLDVARYGESNGRDRDVLFPTAWRYRDYVINSFNQDKPYDRFIQEQVAGDLLEGDQETLFVATGFLTLGPKSFMKRGKEFEMDLIDEQIDVTTRAILGLTASCARCHDHKFDPIPTKDYYSLAGIFASSKTLYGPNSNPKGPKNLQPLGKGTANPKEIAAYKKELAELVKRRQASVTRLKKLEAGEKIDTQKGAPLTVEQERNRLGKLDADLKKLKATAPKMPEYCMAVREDKPVDLNVLIRGDIKKLGEKAPRGVLSCVPLGEPLKVNPKQSGRRELAEWLTDRNNPLTARVAVNRIWHHLFGQGIVDTTDNFGHNGTLPSHPELLDFLAKRFMDQGWSFKKLIRDIVMTRTYQLAAAYDAGDYEIDPDNVYLWRRSLRRQDVESMHDAILAASGELVREPMEESLVAEIGFGEVGRGINTKPLERPFVHRAVYMPILRTSLPEMLKVFDFPEPSLVSGNRAVTTVPNQALFLMNSAFVIDNCRAMVERLFKSAQAPEDRVELAYKLALARSPTDTESKRALAFLANIQDNLKKQQVPEGMDPARLAWTSFCQALFASAEFRYLP